MGILNKYFMVVESDQPPQVFLNDTISFVILGFVMFMFIKSYNKLKKEEVVTEKAPTTKVCSDCAMEIPVAAKKCGHCGNTAV